MAAQWISFGLFAVLAAGLLFLAALAGAGRFGEMPAPVVDQFVPELPARPLVPEDLDRLRLGVVWRGYSPSQVDRLLTALRCSWEADRGEPGGVDPSVAEPDEAGEEPAAVRSEAEVEGLR